MARISAKSAQEDYKGGGGEFFSLKNDGDTAVVRFLYDCKDDSGLDIFAVHEVEIAGKKRYVDCDIRDCDLCKEGNRAKAKIFLQLLDTRDDKVKTWERGQKFVAKIMGLINKYGPLVNREYEIQRNGKPGSTDTTYEVYPLDKDDAVLDEFPEKQDLLDGFILTSEAYLNGDNGAEEKEEEPVQRRGSGRRGGSESRGESRGDSKTDTRGGRDTSRRRRSVDAEDTF